MNRPPIPERPRSRPIGLAAIGPLLAVASCGQSVPGGPNVLLVSIDTLRADYLEPYGDAAPISPNIARLAERGVVFEEAWSSSSWTLPSMASLQTGLYTSAHGCWEFRSRLDWSVETLAERFTAAGYDTAAIVTHVFLGRKHGMAQGFVHYDDEMVEDFGKSHEAITSPRATDKARAWLEAKAAAGDDRPWYLWVHYFDPHEVYQRHEIEAEAFGEADDRELYRGEIAYTDRHLGLVFDALEAGGFGDNTIVGLVADHGEEWNDHGDQGHGHTLYREVVRIPLILAGPGIVPGRVRQPVSMVDIAPTLLDCAGLEPLHRSPGQSFLDALRGGELEERSILAELGRSPNKRMRALASERYKLIVYESEDRAELYDRSADPTEQVDLASERPELVEQLLARLNSLVQSDALAGATGTLASSLELGTSESEALEALGYVDEP